MTKYKLTKADLEDLKKLKNRDGSPLSEAQKEAAADTLLRAKLLELDEKTTAEKEDSNFAEQFKNITKTILTVKNSLEDKSYKLLSCHPLEGQKNVGWAWVELREIEYINSPIKEYLKNENYEKAIRQIEIIINRLNNAKNYLKNMDRKKGIFYKFFVEMKLQEEADLISAAISDLTSLLEKIKKNKF